MCENKDLYDRWHPIGLHLVPAVWALLVAVLHERLIFAEQAVEGVVFRWGTGCVFASCCVLVFSTLRNMSRNMRRFASEPSDLRVSFSERKAAAQTQAVEVTGSVAISAFPESPKRLDVNFVLSADTLKIRLLQAVDGDVRKFDMCSLDLAELVVGWVWGITILLHVG